MPPLHVPHGSGPVWWPLATLGAIRSSPGMRRVAAGWLVAALLCVALAVAEAEANWSALPLELGPMALWLTVYPPLLVAILLAVWLGPMWGVVPAWLATFVSGLVSGMPVHLAAMFAIATPVEIVIVWGSMVVLKISPDLRRRRDVVRYLGAAVLGALASSLAVLIWVDTQRLDLAEGERIWEGWVLGDLLQLAVVAPLILRFAGPRIRLWLDHRFPVPPRAGMRYTSSVALTTTVVAAMSLLVFQGADLVLDSLAASAPLQNVEGAALMERVRGVAGFLGLLVVLAVVTTMVFAGVLAQRGERERNVALRDPLTGSFNRRAFYTLFQKESDRSRRLGAGIALIFLDIDHFKRLNDAHGHETGDRVLEQLARRIQHTLREHDLLFRWGGEEFVVLLPHSGEGDALAVAERIRQAVAGDPLVRSDVPQPLRVTLSLGVAAAGSLPADANALVARADAATYLAKYNGRDRVETASSLDETAAPGKI